MTAAKNYDDVLMFWFGSSETTGSRMGEMPAKSTQWFQSSPAFDEAIASHFGDLLEPGRSGALDHWQGTPEGSLALVILLDQFPRNIFRGKPESFAYDAKALSVAQAAVTRGDDQRLPLVMRTFFYLPFEHSEDPQMQERCLELAHALPKDNNAGIEAYRQSFLQFAQIHRDLIQRFGRFPHRNAILGRAPTEAEEKYLADGGQTFGTKK